MTAPHLPHAGIDWLGLLLNSAGLAFCGTVGWLLGTQWLWPALVATFKAMLS